MGSQFRSAQDGNIYRIREFELEKVSLVEEFDILQIVGEGWFGKILLVEHKATDREMVLKALPKPYTALIDFYREFHYGLHLGAHKNIITAYDVAFETAGFYVFSQEYAPLGDLTSNVSDIGIGELHTKRVAKQLASALEFIHKKELVHRDVKLDNILVFKSDFSRIKLCDFGETRPQGSVVMRRNEWLPYAAPEILQVATDENYVCNTSHDVWQFGIVIFVCLTGCLPWQKAAFDDPRYVRYSNWHSSSLAMIRVPKLFKLVSSRAQRFFKRFLDPKEERRPNNLKEVYRYLDDRWMSKGMEKTNEAIVEGDGLCPSMYSFHSSPEEKNKILHTLTQYGLETTVDRNAKKDRIKKWIENSIIVEEDGEEEEGEEEDYNERPSSSAVRTETIRNIGIEKRRARRPQNRHPERVYKPPVDPRVPLENQRVHYSPRSASTSSISTCPGPDRGEFNQNQRYFTSMSAQILNQSNDTINGLKSSHNNSQASFDSKYRNSQKGIMSALPFKNIRINQIMSTTSSDSAFSSESSVARLVPNRFTQESGIAEISENVNNKLKFV